VKQVYLSPLAEKKLINLLTYLEENWSKRVRDAFLEQVLEKFQFVSNQPNGCPESTEFPNLFKCVVAKQTSFYYRINEDAIEVITFFDNRQNPKSLKKELR
jgi:plasmid stabilization system protein ParE